MREYGKVFSRIWESEDFRALTEDGRNLVLYLLTSQHGTIAGVFRLPDGYACEDLQWDAERVSKGFRDLESKGFATRCERTKWVWIFKYLVWNPPENPNQAKAVAKCNALVPDACSWKGQFSEVNSPSEAPSKPIDNGNPSGTLPQPFLNQEQEQEQDKKPMSLPKGEGRFPDFWSSWPSTDRKQDRKKCLEKWRRNRWDDEADAILAHVEAMKGTKKWRDGYEPAPLTYLNGERWKDGAVEAKSESQWAGAV